MMVFGARPPQQQLGKTLERERVVTRDTLRALTKQSTAENRSLIELLYEHPEVSGDTLLELLGKHYDLPTIKLRGKVITPYVINLLPKEIAEEHRVVVFKKIQNEIHLAASNPDHDQIVAFVRRHTKLEPTVFLTTPDDITQALKRYQTELSADFEKIIEDSLRETEQGNESEEDLARHLPIISMVNAVIERALSQHASDIHLEPTAESVVIRFRVDGLLRKIVTLPNILLAPMVARLKLMANLKIDEHRLPQDGRFQYPYNDRDIAVRVSVVPTLHGSKMVLRLLDAKTQRFTLRGLGLNNYDDAIMKREILKPNGMILVTGPTGSGKTTTLYTVLQMLNSETVNICTVEDPIEYGLPGVNQTQINPVGGLTFANGLRSILRQDPNVIMVGEIRDPDTADIAVNAAMTGHLVLSTLHTNSAAQTVQRLVEMGIPPYLLASTLNAVVAQRLVRKVCKYCGTKSHLTERLRETLKLPFDLDVSVQKLQRAGLLKPETQLHEYSIAVKHGCDKCQGTGYLGRLGIYQVLSMNNDFHEVLIRTQDPAAIDAEAARQNILTMTDDGVGKILQGQTTFEELLRVIT